MPSSPTPTSTPTPTPTPTPTSCNPCTNENISGVNLIFLGSQCASEIYAATQFPYVYVSTQSSGNGPATDGSYASFRDTALAAFAAPTSDPPINQGRLDALATQFAADFTAWFCFTGDLTYVGVCNLAPTPLYDEIVVDYFVEGTCKTRWYTPPVIDWGHELGHFDSQAWQDCDDSYGNLTAFPCVYYYGNPTSLTYNSGTKILTMNQNKYMLCLWNMRLQSFLIDVETTEVSLA